MKLYRKTPPSRLREPSPYSILFTIPNFITAGSGQALVNFLQRLDRMRFNPTVCVLRKGGRLIETLERMSIPVLEFPFTVPAKPYSSLLQRAWRAAQPFRQYDFSLWHSWHYLDDYTEPIIARLSGTTSWIYTKNNMNWKRRAWYARTILASKVIAQNRDMMSDFFSGVPFSNKARLVPRGVDTDRFHPDTPMRLRLRERLGIPSRAIVIGCVAHLVPVKGHPTLIRAMARVPNTHLVLAGRFAECDYVAELRSLVATLNLEDRVHFVDEVVDIPALLVEMDIAVLPTYGKWRREGCPVALLEAMSSGKACIATEIPGSRDIVEHNRNGLLVPPEDIDALANAVRRLRDSSDLRSALGHGARMRVIQNFSIAKEAEAHQSLYRDILE